MRGTEQPWAPRRAATIAITANGSARPSRKTAAAGIGGRISGVVTAPPDCHETAIPIFGTAPYFIPIAISFF
jgi:hypothetical protein